MITFLSIMLLMSMFALGMKSQQLIITKNLQSDAKKIIHQKNEIFSEILMNFSNTQFRSRVNYTVYLTTKTSKHGQVDLIYLMDKSDLAIFQGDNCLYTSESVEKELLFNLLDSINRKFKYHINDTVEVLGFTFYREDFEKTFGGKLKNLNLDSIFSKEENEIETIKKKNDKKFNIDEILDKISHFGIKY